MKELIAKMEPGRVVVLWSGGWESTYCMLLARLRYDALGVGFDYGQEYAVHELRALTRMRTLALSCRRDLPFVWTTSPVLMRRIDGDRIFPMRNALLISLVAALQPAAIYFGSRNLLPFIDRYHDSNWWWGKAMSRALRVPVRMPCTGWTKGKVIARTKELAKLHSFDGLPERIYSSEGL